MHSSVFNDLTQALTFVPHKGFQATGVASMAFAVFALFFGLQSGLFQFSTLKYDGAWYLPVTMIFFPSLPEELFFRGVLIPRKVFDSGIISRTVTVLVSTILFTIWHPFNAWLFNPSAQVYFYDLRFLCIVAALGVVCSVAYIATKSIWPPVVIHWLTIICWVFAFGGRNMIGEVLMP